jgi:hypothetical protein
VLQEDNGLIAVHRACVDMNAIWRPTPTHDIGVDGQIELLEDNSNISSGIIFCVQVKSGPSYFKNMNKDIVTYYPKSTHIDYWSRLDLPVILILHNPDEEMTIFCDVKKKLRLKNNIELNTNHIFSQNCREHLIDIYRENKIGKSSQEVLRKLYETRIYFGNRYSAESGSNFITGIDFLLACIKDKDVMEITISRYTTLKSLLNYEYRNTITEEDYNFIFRMSMLIISFQVTDNFFKDFEEMWYENNLVPEIRSFLTEHGKKLIKMLFSNIDCYLDINKFDTAKSVQDIIFYCNCRSLQFDFKEQ